MLIVIFSIMLLIIGIILPFVYKRINHFYTELDFISFAFRSAGMIVLIISLTMCGVTYVNADIDYQNKLEEKELLEYRINQQNDIVGNELLYSQIVEFNNDLRYTKKWAKNPWTNWFFNQKIADNIDYINFK